MVQYYSGEKNHCGVRKISQRIRAHALHVEGSGSISDISLSPSTGDKGSWELPLAKKLGVDTEHTRGVAQMVEKNNLYVNCRMILKYCYCFGASPHSCFY